MKKSLINKFIYMRIVLLTGLSVLATNLVSHQAGAKTEISEAVIVVMGKNNYLDFKTYSNEVTEPVVPKVPLIEQSTNSQKVINSPKNTIKAATSKTELRFPLSIPGNISSPYGWRIDPFTGAPHLHEGVDFVVPIGTPVLATVSGQVAIAGEVGGYGRAVILRHEQNTRESRYAHLSQIFVKPGDQVKEGTVIGLAGNTGWSTGPHLHFEWRELTNGSWIPADPGFLLAQARVKMLTAQRQTPILPKPKPSLSPSQYRRAPSSSKSLFKKNLPISFALKMPDQVTSVLRRRFFGLYDHFLASSARNFTSNLSSKEND